jgi:hypothetical protein
MSVRKAHNSGRNHLRNVVDYYQRMASRHNLTSNTDCYLAEIGHEKAQSVIDSITSSYAAEGQSSSNPMLGQNPGVNPPPPFAFPGGTSPPFPYLFRHKLTNTLLQVSHLHPSACLGCLQCPACLSPAVSPKA